MHVWPFTATTALHAWGCPHHTDCLALPWEETKQSSFHRVSVSKTRLDPPNEVGVGEGGRQGQEDGKRGGRGDVQAG